MHHLILNSTSPVINKKWGLTFNILKVYSKPLSTLCQYS